MTGIEDKYTAITFSPVQEFIEKSRKLRDLYGSSFILSYLSRAVCDKAKLEQHCVISPAMPNLTQGTPNLIVIQGFFSRNIAEQTFNEVWQQLVNQCRCWIEKELPQFQQDYHENWKRCWQQWANHAWEFFWATGATSNDARNNLMSVKQSRNWTAINWTGESSSLSGTDAIVWHGMGRIIKEQERSFKRDEEEIEAFYAALKQKLEGTVDKIEAADINIKQEQLSIPEMVKRLLTYDQVADNLQIPKEERPLYEVPKGFADLNRYDRNYWTGWFKGDGDRMGSYVRSLTDEQCKRFSEAMMEWSKTLKSELPESQQAKKVDREGRIVYAGGDDFFGVLYRKPKQSKSQEEFELLNAAECVNWLQKFPHIWQQHGQVWQNTGKLITASAGFVWAAPKVPQRDVLQHCNEAESNAKKMGRDRIALRVLFNSGTYLEWVCPWRFLPVLQDYYDPQDGKQDWIHFYNDVAVLAARHAFRGNQTEVAVGLLRVYFEQSVRSVENEFWNEQDRTEFYGLFNDNQPLNFNQSAWWNTYNGNDPYDPKGQPISTGILGDRRQYVRDKDLDLRKVHQSVNNWIINLAKVGFHLCGNSNT
jgi:CRISPR-associated protein Cmr2